MAVTVVRGFVGKSDADGNSGRHAKTTSSNTTSHNSQSHSNLESALGRSSEAVVSALRVAKLDTAAEKIRLLQEAERLTEAVAERVSDEDHEGTRAHSTLSPHSARQHFA